MAAREGGGFSILSVEVHGQGSLPLCFISGGVFSISHCEALQSPLRNARFAKLYRVGDAFNM